VVKIDPKPAVQFENGQLWFGIVELRSGGAARGAEQAKQKQQVGPWNTERAHHGGSPDSSAMCVGSQRDRQARRMFQVRYSTFGSLSLPTAPRWSAACTTPFESRKK